MRVRLISLSLLSALIGTTLFATPAAATPADGGVCVPELYMCAWESTENYWGLVCVTTPTGHTHACVCEWMNPSDTEQASQTDLPCKIG